MSFLNKHVVKKVSFLPIGERSNLITKNILFSFFFRGGQVFASLLIVPISLEILTKTEYGLWLTVFSFTNWFNFFDIGLGNGLRNKLASSLANEEFNSAKKYVSTAYYTIIGVTLTFLTVFLVVNQFINWNLFLNIPNNISVPIKLIIVIVFTSFCFRLVLKLITSIALAKQWAAIRDLQLFLTKVMILFALYISTFSSNDTLVLYSLLYSSMPVIVLLILTIVLFKSQYKKIRPNIRFFRKNKVKEILRLGGNFFIIQISMAVLFMSDNVIISNILSPAAVTPYQVANKYFSVPMMGFGILMTPMWSAYTEAFAKKEIDWIKKSIQKFEKIWILFLIAIIVMALASNYVIKFWLDNKVVLPTLLILGMALFALLQSLNSIYTNLLNGLSKIKLQKYTALSSILINIPLSIYFAKYLNLGSAGVIFATNISLLIYIVTRKIQVTKIIEGTAKGVWNE